MDHRMPEIINKRVQWIHCSLFSWHRDCRRDLLNSQIQDNVDWHMVFPPGTRTVWGSAQWGLWGSGNSPRFPRRSLVRTLRVSNDSCQSNSTARPSCEWVLSPKIQNMWKRLCWDTSITLDLSYCSGLESESCTSVRGRLRKHPLGWECVFKGSNETTWMHNPS